MRIAHIKFTNQFPVEIEFAHLMIYSTYILSITKISKREMKKIVIFLFDQQQRKVFIVCPKIQ